LPNVTGTASNNIVARNGGGVSGAPTMMLHNNDVFGSAVAQYSGLSPGADDMAVDPKLASSPDGWLHIEPNSPCIDAGWNDAPGLPALDIDGQTRVRGSAVDIGADEWWASIEDAKKTPSTLPMELSSQVVTATFPDFLYIEADNRACGIKVEKAGHAVSVGDRVDVHGTLQTGDDGEHCITAEDVSRIGSGSMLPLLLNNSAVGGGPCGCQEGVWGWCWTEDGKRVWTQVGGISTIGLLVTTTGRVLPELTTTTSMTIDDGSNNTVKCILPDGLVPDSSWGYIVVTGIASCEKVGGELHRILRVRGSQDVSPVCQ
jgi:hypothetical protein